MIMEEKKYNNAIEKTEKLSDDTLKVKAENSTNTKKKNTSVKKYDKKEKTKTADAKKSEIALKQKKEEEKAAARMQKAEQKQKKKEERLKAAQAKKQAAQRKRESLKELRLKRKEERIARRDMLKQETKEQRHERIMAEKEHRAQLKREKRQQQAELRREKQQLRRERLAAKNAERKQKQKTRSSRGIGGWLAAVISLGCTSLVLATILVWNIFMVNGGQGMLQGVYAKSFYDLVGYVDNIDVNLDKLNISNDADNSQKILSDVIVQANLAENDLQTLPLEDESRFYTVKFVNQLSDFGKYLNNKLIDGEKVTKDDKNTLQQLRKINKTLKGELNDLSVTLGDNFDFTTLLTGESENIVLKKFNDMQSNAVEYPKMIYDGPFADQPEEAAKDKTDESKFIDEAQAKQLFIEYFEQYSPEQVAVEGSGEGNGLQVFTVNAVVDGENFYAQIAKSGELVMFDWYKECSDINYGRDECIEIATAFLEKCGYKSIKAVWTTQNGTTTYVNFVPIVSDGIIIYADMIKVSVCMERGMVYSMDATAYVKNHTQRDIPVPALTIEQAEKKLSLNINTQTWRLAYIPLETGKEKLAYEFFGEGEDGDYYVYIDAITGKELEIFKVVQTNEGTLLL